MLYKGYNLSNDHASPALSHQKDECIAELCLYFDALAELHLKEYETWYKTICIGKFSIKTIDSYYLGNQHSENINIAIKTNYAIILGFPDNLVWIYWREEQRFSGPLIKNDFNYELLWTWKVTWLDCSSRRGDNFKLSIEGPYKLIKDVSLQAPKANYSLKRNKPQNEFKQSSMKILPLLWEDCWWSYPSQRPSNFELIPNVVPD